MVAASPLMPVALAIAALSLWHAVKGIQEPVEEEEATLLMAMVLNRNLNDCVADADLLGTVNEERRKRGLATIESTRLNVLLDKLACAGTIKRSRNSADHWFISERCRVGWE